MTIVNKFDSVDEFNKYHQNSLSNNNLLKVDNPYIEFCITNITNQECFSLLSSLLKLEIDLSSFKMSVQQLIMNQGATAILSAGPTKYIFIGSKTSFRKTIHSNMISSFYKKYYNLLKENQVILQATGSFVIVVEHSFTEQDLEKLQTTENNKDVVKSVNTLLANYEELQNDNKFLLDKINELSNNIFLLHKENQILLDNLNDKILTTWY